MLKHVTVPIIVDDNEPEKCGNDCEYIDDVFGDWCMIFNRAFLGGVHMRCKQCLEEAK